LAESQVGYGTKNPDFLAKDETKCTDCVYHYGREVRFQNPVKIYTQKTDLPDHMSSLGKVEEQNDQSPFSLETRRIIEAAKRQDRASGLGPSASSQSLGW